MKQLFLILNKYLFCEYLEDFDTIKIPIQDLETNFNNIKRLLKILVYEAQYKHIKKNRIVLEISSTDILSDKVLVLFNIMKLTKTLHYFKIKIEKNTDSSLDNQFTNRLNLITKDYSGINIK